MRFSFRVICIVLAILFSIINVCAAENRETKRVLILAGHFKNQPAVQLAEKGIQQIFQANPDYRIKQEIEYLDLYRFASKDYKRKIVDLLNHKYGDRQIDIVITILTSALRFMLDYGDEIFPGIPTVFTVVSEPTLTGLNLPGNVTGISYELDIKGTLETALKLQPNTKHVVLVGGVSKTIGGMCKKAKKIFQSHEGDLQFTYLTDHSMDQILEQVARLPKDSIIFNMGMYKDKAGNVFIPMEAMAQIAGKSSVPSYGVFETFMGHGIVGGRLVGYEAQGKKAAQYALDILKGAKPSDLPVTSYETIVPMFDWRQLKKWGLDEQRLPEGSIVRFKELTTWGAYKWYIIGGISLFIIEAILILLLLFNWARRLRAESALRKSHKELELRVEDRTAELSKTNEQLREEIKEHKVAETALRKSEQHYRSTLNDLLVGVVVHASDTSILLSNPEATNILGLTYEQMSGKKSIDPEWSFVHEDSTIMKVEDYPVSKVVSTRKPLHGYVLGINRPDRNYVTWVIVNASPVFSIDSELEKVVVNFVDITSHKQMEEALRESEEKLTRSNKMEAMGLMAGGVAHDLNNILSGIVSYPELILLDLPEDSPLRKPIKTIQESGMRAADVVEDLLTIARGVASGKEVLNLNTVVEEYLDSAEHQKLERIHPLTVFKTELDSELLNITGSASHVKKILMNLIVNASEAIEGKGTVTVSTINRYLDEPLKGYEDVRTGEYVVLAISDDGSGISPQDLDRIFEPFYTKKVMGRSGTGLGLAVVWNTVQDHKGYINVKSSEKGTVFELYFPVTREEVAAEKEEVPLDDYIGHGEKILVVDDEERQRQIASGILTRLGYNAETVSSGEAAIEYVKEHPVDLIVLDMVMPKGINGRKTYEEIIKIHPGQKAIIASGYAKTKEVDRAQELGAGKYIKKPYTLPKVGLAVKEELGK